MKKLILNYRSVSSPAETKKYDKSFLAIIK